MDLQELKEYCRQLANDGVDAATIEQQVLDQEGTDSDKIFAIKHIDEYVSVYELYQQGRQKYLQQMMLGGVLLFMGLGSLTVGLGTNYFRKLVVAIIVLLGGWVVKQGYKKYQEPINDGFTKDRKFKSGDIRKFYSK